MIENRQFTLTITRDDDGSYVAEVVNLPGCFASGRTPEELEEALVEAIEMYLSTEDFAVLVVVTDPGRIARILEGADRELPASVELVPA